MRKKLTTQTAWDLVLGSLQKVILSTYVWSSVNFWRRYMKNVAESWNFSPGTPSWKAGVGSLCRKITILMETEKSCWDNLETSEMIMEFPKIFFYILHNKTINRDQKQFRMQFVRSLTPLGTTLSVSDFCCCFLSSRVQQIKGKTKMKSPC